MTKTERLNFSVPATTLARVGASDRTIDVVCSTEEINCYGYAMKQSGWMLDNYALNPVVLYGHNDRADFGVSVADSLPIGRAENVRVEDGSLKATIRFASAEANPFAERVYRLMAEDMLRAVSVGFAPIDVTVEMRNGAELPVITRAELLELSIVPIGADPGAVREKNAHAITHLTNMAARTVAAETPMADEDIPVTVDVTDERSDELKQILAAIGADTTLAALAKIGHVVDESAKVAELTAKVAELQSKLDEGERVALLVKLRSEGKITPHSERFASKLSLADLRAEAETLPVIPALVAPLTEEPKAESVLAHTYNGKTWRELSNMEKHDLAVSYPVLFKSMRDSAR